jgi:carboxymethylenebutenolidase
MDRGRAGTAYLALPDGADGPGILVLHGWWGLTPFFKDVCDRLASEGFVALAPDLFGGETAATPDEAEALLAAASPDALAHLSRSSLVTLRDAPTTPDAPVGVVGFSMGASMALWLAARVPEEIAGTAVFYGVQDIDMAESTCAFLGHFAEDDPLVPDDDLTLLEADLHLLGRATEFHHYPGTGHWFFERDRPQYDEAAATLAWDRTIDFFRRTLGSE